MSAKRQKSYPARCSGGYGIWARLFAVMAGAVVGVLVLAFANTLYPFSSGKGF
jgi:hypothetical protein